MNNEKIEAVIDFLAKQEVTDSEIIEYFTSQVIDNHLSNSFFPEDWDHIPQAACVPNWAGGDPFTWRDYSSKQELLFQEWYDNREVPIVGGLTREEARTGILWAVWKNT